MEDNNRTGSPSQNNPAYTGIAREKVIQPSSVVTEELRASQPTPVQQEPALPVGTQASAAEVQQARPNAAPAPVYPEATKGVGMTGPAPVPTDLSTSKAQVANAKAGPRVLAVQIVGGAIILLSAFNAYDWFLEKRAGYTNWLSILEICAVAALAVGIFKLSEFARSAYVLLSAVSLVLSCVGLIFFYASTHHNASYQANTRPLTRAQLEKSLEAAEDNTALPSQARQEDIQQLQREINNTSDTTTTGLNTKQYLSTGLLLVTAIGPLIFLTRPTIKEVFK